MSPEKDEASPHRWLRRLPGLGRDTGGNGRLSRLELLGLVNGGIFLVAVFLLSFPLSLTPLHLGALSVLPVCFGIALWLRRRFRTALEGEWGRRKRAEQEARAADRAKGQFLADISHEIRTPMNGVLGMAGLLLRGELTPAQRDRVEVIQTSAEALLALVNDILDLARIEAGRLLLHPQDFRLRELAGDVVRLLAPKAVEKEIELRLRVAPGLPDDLHGDPARLRQVLLNLVGNAIRFTGEGSVTITIEPLQGEGKAPAIGFQVRDTGSGIRPEVQARLFQPFTQSDSSISRQLGGTGLGLVISKNLVELMGGAIGFESIYGVGSTFWFRVPLAPAAPGSGPRDDGRLGELQRLGETIGRDVLDPMVKAFLRRGAEDLEAMEKALARGDGKALAAAAHALGGSSGVLGAVALARRCAELDALARTGNLEACVAPLQAVRQEFRDVARKLAP
jgi:signal transduction histidine kinase/HPt (histidine-containing phosphotransfer) domain-containing protein